MSDFVGGVRILDLDAVEVLNLGTGGYAEGPLSEDGFTWRRAVISSPFVDGDFEVQAAKESGVRTLIVHVFGSTWAQVETRREALEAAVSVPFLLEVTLDGVVTTYRASRADVSSPQSASDVMNRRRDVTLYIPVQPNPTVTGI